jgi:hypothetical protein
MEATDYCSTDITSLLSLTSYHQIKIVYSNV